MMKKATFLFLFWTLSLQAQHRYDILYMDATVHIDTSGQVKGTVQYNFRALENTDTLRWNIGAGIHLQNGPKYGKIYFHRREKQLLLTGRFRKGKSYKIRFDFTGRPQAGMYFTGWNTGAAVRQVWTQGQGKNNSSWMPGKDDLNDKFSWEIRIGFPAGYEVIGSGILKDKTHKNHEIIWHYVQDKPAPYYLLFVGAGNYTVLRDTAAGIPQWHYGYPADSASLAVTYRYAESIIPWLEQETGTPFSWPVYREIPLRDFFYGGMENLEATTYNDVYYVNDTSLADGRPYNVLAHEAAHHWFGDLVTETNASHHWLHESFATWLAYRIDRRIEGRDYAEWQYYRDAQRILDAHAKGDTIPLQNGKASTLSFYQKGAWVIRMMQKRVGEEKFRAVMRDFLKRNAYGNVTTADFQQSLFRVTGDSLPAFFAYWFRSSHLPYYKVEITSDSVLIGARNTGGQKLPIRIYDRYYHYRDTLADTSFSLKTYPNTVLVVPNPRSAMLTRVDWQPGLDDFVYGLRAGIAGVDIVRMLQSIRRYPYKDKQRLFADMARNDYLPAVYDEILLQMPPALDSVDMDIIRRIWKRGPLEQRLVLERLQSVPPELKFLVETGLQARSYMVRALALQALWRHFPAERKALLDRTRHLDKPHDHGLRMLWIILALNTDGYVSRFGSRKLLDELVSYAGPRYNVDTRTGALAFIRDLHIYTPKTLEYARLAAKHFHPVLRRVGKQLEEDIKGNKP